MPSVSRGDLAIIVSTSRVSYLRHGEESTRVRLYQVASVSRDGQVKAVRADANAPVLQVKNMTHEQLLVLDRDGMDVQAALLAVPFEGFDSLEQMREYLTAYRRPTGA